MTRNPNAPTMNSGGKGRRWSHVQATLMKSVCTRAIMNTTTARSHAPNAQIEREFDADIIFFGIMKAEAEEALRRGVGNWV